MNEIKNTDVHIFERKKYERRWKRSLRQKQLWAKNHLILLIVLRQIQT